MAFDTIQPGDARLGTYNRDGTIKDYPRLEYHGAPCELPSASGYQTIRRIDRQYFVVFGVGRDDPELTITVGQAAPVKTGG